MKKRILSKSTFIQGVQCAKALYLSKHSPDLKEPLSSQQQMIFSQGTKVGLFARQFFPGGVDVTPASPSELNESLTRTETEIRSGTAVIYEAAFQFEGVFIALDILVKKQDKWSAYEVKSSTQVSPTYVLDAALQYYVITNCGIEIENFAIIHLNNKYVRKGQLEPAKLFKTVPVLNEVKAKQPFVKKAIGQLKQTLAESSPPQIDIGEHCFKPYECLFKNHCWQHVPEDSVFDLARMSAEKKFALYDSGISKLSDLDQETDEEFTVKQKLQILTAKTRTAYINKNGIAEFLDALQYPLYFMDFETFSPALPLFDESSPYEQIPFQYSLHYLKKKGARLKHSEFLAQPGTDPREEFAKKLVKATKKPGDILVYNKSFEAARLRRLASLFPRYRRKLVAIILRLKDLANPFRKGYYYSPAMKGSASLKKVLPALVDELTYDGLEINDGGMAMVTYERLAFERDREKIKKIRKALLEYCKMDTYAMVRILEKLEQTVAVAE